MPVGIGFVGGTGPYDGNLGQRLTLALDPEWTARHGSLWRHPLGRTLRVTYADWEAGITESVSPNYAEADVIGRAEPYKAWLNNPSRQINLGFRFHAQGINSTDATAIEDEVILPARWLDALKYPVYNPQQNISYAPPPVILTIGSLLVARCVLTGGDIEWQFEAMDTDLLLPHAANFNATFEVVRTFKQDLSYFGSNGPMYGVWQ